MPSTFISCFWHPVYFLIAFHMLSVSVLPSMLPNSFLLCRSSSFPMSFMSASASLTRLACINLFLCHSLRLMSGVIYVGSLDVMVIDCSG